MLEAIQHLLVLQDRDRKILGLEDELARLAPDRDALQTRLRQEQAALDAAKLRGKQLESERKKLELEVEDKKKLIEKYSLQQFQTKKNEEYRALAHEIDTCKQAITQLEDQQLEFMEKAEGEQKQTAAIAQAVAETKKTVDSRVAELNAREQNLRAELATLKAGRSELTSRIEDSARTRYERLLTNKGGKVLVGIQRGVCGGCHMQLSRQIVVSCQADQEIVTCPNCGRILFFTPDMDVVAAE